MVLKRMYFSQEHLDIRGDNGYQHVRIHMFWG